MPRVDYLKTRISLSLICVITFCSAAWAQQADISGSLMDGCLSSTAALDEQIAACTAALEADNAGDVELAYLPPIIAELRGETGDFDAAFARISDAETGGANLLLAMGSTQFQAQRYDLAMIFYQVAKVDYTTKKEVLLGVDAFLDELKVVFADDPLALIELIDVGLTHAPGGPDLLGLRAETFGQLGNFEQAKSDWIRAVAFALYPQHVEFRAARSFWELGLADEALVYLEYLSYDIRPGGEYEALLRSEEPFAVNYAAILHRDLLDELPFFRIRVARLKLNILQTLDDPDATLMAAEEFLKLAPDNVKALLANAEILTVMGRNGDALLAFNAAVEQAEKQDGEEMRVNRRFALWSRAGFYIKTDEVDLAMRDINSVLAEEEPERIKKLQIDLKHLGVFTGEIDGVYDDRTKQAFAQCINESLCDS